MGIKSWLIPQETIFFDYLEEEGENVLNAAKKLREMVNNFDNAKTIQIEIRELEHNGDNMVHNIHEALNKTFITPIDREDISSLALSFDNILDSINAASTRIILYEIKKPTENMKEMVEVVVNIVEVVCEATKGIREMTKLEKINEKIVEVNRLENTADEILRRSLAELLNKEYKEISGLAYAIKMKEIYEFFEKATDMAEDVADVIGNILVKYA
ncbi:MAG: DUF47 family protein [Candidatus Thermoplasmatota archaeon]